MRSIWGANETFALHYGWTLLNGYNMTTKTWYISLIMVFILWGSQHPCFKILSAELPPLPLNALRFTLASLVLFPFVLHKRRIPQRKDLFGIGLLGITGIAVYGILVITGINRSTAVNSSVLLNSHPVITAALAPLLIQEKLSLKKASGIGLGFLGILVVVSGGVNIESILDNQYLAGNFLIVASAFCLALYAIFSKQYVAKYGGVITVFYAMLTGTTLLIFIALINGEISLIFQLSLKTFLLIGYVAVVTTALAWVIWFETNQKIGVIKTGSFFFIIPVSGIMFSAVLLGEKITSSVLTGTGCILVGIYLVQKRSAKYKKAKLPSNSSPTNK
jgi:drug/metabolite transporter (DMT)-like permease